MAAKIDNHVTEMEDDRLSDISIATTCFGGVTDNPHINELREIRKTINAHRRRLITNHKMLLGASFRQIMTII